MIKTGRRYRTIWLYIAKEFILSFTVAFLFFFIIFFINQLLLMAEDILARKAPVGAVVRLVIYAMPAIVAMSFPFGSLVGALMAAGRLGSDNELLVMRAAGIPRRVVFVPFLALGLAFALVSFTMNDVLLPLGTINYGKLYRKLVTTTPALELKPYSVKRYRDTVIVTGGIENGILNDVVIMDTTKSGSSRVIGAARAELVDRGSASGIISLVLDGVFVQESDPSKPDRFEYSSADRMEYNILLSTFSDFSPGVGPREMSSRDVLAQIRIKEQALARRTSSRQDEIQAKQAELLAAYFERTEMGSSLDSSIARLLGQLDALAALRDRSIRDRSLDIYRLEYYKKFSIPAGALFFVFLAFPLGARARKSGRTVGFGLGLLVSVAYWGLLIGGQTLGLRSSLSPFLAMWSPNLLVLLLSIPLLSSRRTA
ncbi:MAG: YjgP/YjgQ family permease [Spirochaetales bacterium]|nr:MAG: YjgP/YjgQ family permease [Spirochaetales bacterium]